MMYFCKKDNVFIVHKKIISTPTSASSTECMMNSHLRGGTLTGVKCENCPLPVSFFCLYHQFIILSAADGTAAPADNTL